MCPDSEHDPAALGESHEASAERAKRGRGARGGARNTARRGRGRARGRGRQGVSVGTTGIYCYSINITNRY